MHYIGPWANWVRASEFWSWALCVANGALAPELHNWFDYCDICENCVLAPEFGVMLVFKIWIAAPEIWSYHWFQRGI
jgi:hypothetical protein